MKVWFVGAGPGDPELLTLRGRRRLSSCRMCIYAGSLVNPRLLDILPPDAERHDSARLSRTDILALVDRARAADQEVVRLHTGEPSLYGAIGEQIDALDRMGVEYRVVPGVSAFQAAAAALAVELTVPETAQTVVLTRTPGRTPMPATESLETFAATSADAGLAPRSVRLLATVDAKRNETGLREAAAAFDRPLRFITHGDINALWRGAPSAAARHVGARAVAEPCALLAGRRTRLLVPKTIRDGVTVAVAREHCSWSDSDPAAPPTAPDAPSTP